MIGAVMRVVIAPDSFGDLSPDHVAYLLAEGWAEVAPGDDVVDLPMSDGGPGLLDVLVAHYPQPPDLGVEASDLLGAALWFDLIELDHTVYVESALSCGLRHLHRLQRRGHPVDVRTTTTYGVGQAVAFAARQPGVERVVVGLGGSGTNDGGAGLWAALGAEPADVLRGGGIALRHVADVTPPPDLAVQLVAATDVDNPLLGLHGASAVYGPQKGADRAAVMELDAALERWADLVEPAVGRPGLRDEPGAGAAGGLGFGLMALGAERFSGIELVMDLIGLRDAVEGADLVVTGEGRFDATSLRGKVVSGVARVAQEAGVPVVVAAGQAAIGGREAAAHGIDEIRTVAELVGGVDAALAAGREGIQALGAAIARAWSR